MINNRNILLRARKQRALAAVAAIAAIVTATIGIMLFARQRMPAPDFTLPDAGGGAFRLSARRGHVVALVFGYTHCPDVCPTTLASLARAKRLLGSTVPVDIVFVTVDPQRDSTRVVGKFVGLFDANIVGLSGTPAALAPVYAAYHVYRAALPAQGSRGYLMAHSSQVDVIGVHGRIRTIADWDDSPQQFAAAFRNAGAS